MQFLHGGHVSKINDLDWNPSRDLCLASVEEDNYLHIYEIPNKALTS